MLQCDGAPKKEQRHVPGHFSPSHDGRDETIHYFTWRRLPLAVELGRRDARAQDERLSPSPNFPKAP
jgi:hypothetical protein